MYLKYEALEDSECSGSKGMETEHYIIELNGIDSSWVTMKVLILNKKRIHVWVTKRVANISQQLHYPNMYVVTSMDKLSTQDW